MEEAIVDGREFGYERESNVWFSGIRFERGEGESEKVSFLDRCQSFIGYETPHLKLRWYY